MVKSNTYGSNTDQILGLAALIHREGADAQYKMGRELPGMAKISCYAIAQATYALSCEMALKSLIAYKSGTQKHPHSHIIPKLLNELECIESNLHDKIQEKLRNTLSDEELKFLLRDVDHSGTSKYLDPSVALNVLALKKGCDIMNQTVQDVVITRICHSSI